METGAGCGVGIDDGDRTGVSVEAAIAVAEAAAAEALATTVTAISAAAAAAAGRVKCIVELLMTVVQRRGASRMSNNGFETHALLSRICSTHFIITMSLRAYIPEVLSYRCGRISIYIYIYIYIYKERERNQSKINQPNVIYFGISGRRIFSPPFRKTACFRTTSQRRQMVIHWR